MSYQQYIYNCVVSVCVCVVCVCLESDQLHEDIRSGKDTGPRDDNAPSNGKQQSNYNRLHVQL